jgi:hypothetical protein
MATREELLSDGWLVQPTLDRMSRSGVVVHLRPRAMDVLACLAARAGQVVPRKTIIDQVWAREFVSDAALKTAVYELREAFGDACRNPRAGKGALRAAMGGFSPLGPFSDPIWTFSQPSLEDSATVECEIDTGALIQRWIHPFPWPTPPGRGVGRVLCSAGQVAARK